MILKKDLDRIENRIAKLKEKYNAGVAIIAPDATGGYILSYNTYSIRRDSHYATIEAAQEAHKLFLKDIPIIIIDV